MYRALRRFHTNRIIKNRLKLLKQIEPVRSSYFDKMLKESGRLRKRHPFDCGKTRCYLCHSEKQVYNKRRRREFRCIN
jgi:hypothetical protein